MAQEEEVKSGPQPTGVVYLLPRIVWIVYENKLTGKKTEVLQWNPKEGAVITGLKVE